MERVGGSVVEVKEIDKKTSSKSSFGSGFYVSSDGFLITNFHVVADTVFQPQTSSSVLETSAGDESVDVVAVDVVHDLALLKAKPPKNAPLTFVAVEPGKGTRAFSVGNPHDLGKSVVPGTINGEMENRFSPLIHFSGSINGGMSGGPAVDAAGNVVGVNVQTGGNGIGLLVPARFADELLKKGRSAKQPAELLLDIEAQLVARQQVMSEALLASSAEPASLGAWHAPGQWIPQLKTWATTKNAEEDRRYSATHYTAGLSNDAVFLHRNYQASSVSWEHQVMTKEGASSLAIYRSARGLLKTGLVDTLNANEEDVGRYHCRTDTVVLKGIPWTLATCFRAVKRFHGLFDMTVRMASAAADDHVLVSELVLSAFSKQNATAILKKYLGDFTWTRSSSN